uniref:UPAR/Ly6 domain-containing protein n=1 Tax=Gouania willdenowi TaxID=441366 RepID=A0A8C5HEG0_GOUWI
MCNLIHSFFPPCLTGNMVTKGCHNSAACVGPIKCCEGDLCNDAATTGPSVKMMLLVSSAIMALFL